MNTHQIAEPTGDQPPLARWRLDPAASSAEFRVPHFWGLITVKGHFERLDGWLETDASDRHRLGLTIEAASLHTGSRKRDKHLRSGDFFDARNHPRVRFRSTSASDAGGDRLHVEGVLEVAGERIPLMLDPTIRRGDRELDIDAVTTVDQRLLGMTWSPLGMTKAPATSASTRACSESHNFETDRSRTLGRPEVRRAPEARRALATVPAGAGNWTLIR